MSAKHQKHEKARRETGKEGDSRGTQSEKSMEGRSRINHMYPFKLVYMLFLYSQSPLYLSTWQAVG